MQQDERRRVGGSGRRHVDADAGDIDVEVLDAGQRGGLHARSIPSLGRPGQAAPGAAAAASPPARPYDDRPPPRKAWAHRDVREAGEADLVAKPRTEALRAEGRPADEGNVMQHQFQYPQVTPVTASTTGAQPRPEPQRPQPPATSAR